MGFFSGISKALFGGGGGPKGPSLAEQTAGAYTLGESTFGSIARSRETTETTYLRNMSSGRARMAASGSVLEGSTWESIKGEALRKRTEGRKGADVREAEFRGTENYKLLKADYERMTGGGKAGKGMFGAISSMVSGLTGKGASGEDLYGGQGGSVQKFFRKDHMQTYAEYRQKIKPTLKEWEQGRFGTREQKAEYKTMMGSRVKEANKWYSQNRIRARMARKIQNRFYRSKQGRTSGISRSQYSSVFDARGRRR